MAILRAGADGKAPAGAKVGDTVVTNGGNFTITGTKLGGGFTSSPAPAGGGSSSSGSSGGYSNSTIGNTIGTITGAILGNPAIGSVIGSRVGPALNSGSSGPKPVAPQYAPRPETPASKIDTSNVSKIWPQVYQMFQNNQNRYVQPTESDMALQAKQFADLQTDPVIAAIQKQIATANTNAANSRNAIESAYAGVADQTQARLGEARQAALENAVSRGMGRSGVVDWQTAKLSEPIVAAEAQANNERAQKLSAVDSDLANTLANLSDSQTQAETRRGDLTAAQLADLQNQNNQLGMQNGQNLWGQGLDLLNYGQSADTAEWAKLWPIVQAILGY